MHTVLSCAGIQAMCDKLDESHSTWVELATNRTELAKPHLPSYSVQAPSHPAGSQGTARLMHVGCMLPGATLREVHLHT